jgi:hypothetical protein
MISDPPEDEALDPDAVGTSQLRPRACARRRGLPTDNQMFTELFSIDSASC